MGIILIIIGLVVGLSLYDFFSAKSWQEVTSDERNNLVFEEQFQEYGAFQIRKRYSFNLILITCGVILSIGTAFGIYKIIESLPKPKEKETELDLSTFKVDAKKEEDKLVEPLEPEIPEMQKQQQYLEPVFTNDNVETPPVIVDPGTPVGPTEVKGGDFGGSDGQAPPPPPPPIPEPEPEILEVVEEFAEFPGGKAALNKYLSENINYPETAKEMGVQGTVYIRFVVSENGTISNVKVTRPIEDCPECSKEAVRIYKLMPKWKPAKNNGKEVNSYYNSKVKFQLN